MGAILAAVAIVAGILASIEAVARRSPMAAEYARKAAHVVIGLIGVGLSYFMPLPEVGLVALIFMPVMLVSRQRRWMPSIHGPERSTWGELYFPLGIVVASLAASNHLAFRFGVLIMALSDAAAGVVGLKFGKRALSLGPVLMHTQKTVEGSTAFFAVTFFLSWGFLINTGQSGLFVVVSALVITLVLTYIEAMLGWGLDNLFLPVAGALLISVPLIFGRF